MSATLNKTVPWNVKGVGFDAREIAHRAARREGVPVGQWLNGVIRARADELGVSVDDFTQEERLDALVARLAGVAESVKAEEKSAEVRTATSTSRAGASGTASTPSMSRSWTDDDDFPVRQSASRRGDSDRSSPLRTTPDQLASDNDRSGRRWDGDILLDQAMELVGRRTSAAEERAVSERQRQRIAALAREVERLNKAEADSSADRLRHRKTEQPAEQARPTYAQPFAAAQSASASDRRSFARARNPGAAEDTLRREDRMSGRVPQDMLQPQAAAMSDGMRTSDGRYGKLTSRFEELAQGEAAPRERDWGHASVSDEDGRASRPSARRVQTGRRDAIAEIAERQADLEAFERRSADLLNSASHASMETARHNQPAPVRSAQPAPPPAPSQSLFGNGDPFDNLNDAFAKLTQRLEARLDEATRIRAQAARQPDPEIGALKAGIAALGTRLDAMKDQAELSHATAAEHSGVEALRNEIAALQVGLAKLAPQSSIATLESAVRELGGQIDDSRREGVSEAVLQPIERLRSEVRKAVEAGEVRGAIERIEHQLVALAERAEANDSAGVVLSGLDELRGETAEIRGLLQTTASQFEAIALLESEIGQLGSRIERLTEASPRAAFRELELATNAIRTMLVEVSPETALQDLSRKLDGLGARFGLIEEHIAAPMAMFDEFARRMDDAHAALAERLIRAAPAVDLAPIEDMIGDLSGKIDGLRYPVADMQALGGLIRGLAAQIEEARVPNADARILDGLEMQVSRLAERLDKSDASLDAIGSVERLVRDLFSQLDDTRTATIDAAETAARTAAEETLRGLGGSASAPAPDGAAPAARVLEQVSQELAEFRKAQQNSEKRVHSTLLALNETLQRMVDTAVAAPAPAASGSKEVAATPVSAEISAPVVDAKPIEPEAKIAPVVAASQASASQASAAEVAPVEIKRPVATAPVVDIGRPAALAEPMPDVSPLIAAARRAAQAAQTSAAEVNRKTDLWDLTSKSGSQARTSTAKGWRTLFRQKRRPMLLSVASVVLLLGALEIARLKMPSHSDDTVETSDASATPASTADQTASIAPAAKSDSKAATVSTADGASSTVAPANKTASLTSPAASGITADKPVSATGVSPTDTAPKTAPTLRTLADSGDAAAEAELGTRYADGRGVTRDIKTAANWFQRAADQGYAPAEYRLGSAYEKGNGVPADASQAVGWYEKAATQGNIRAMHNLAVMAAEGSAGKADYARAATWFTKAAERGVRDSQYNLAILYARGLGLAQDLSQSYMWFAVAAAQGDADAAKKRDDVATKLDPEKLASAKAAANSFKPLPVDKAANDILPPPGGWDVASPAVTGSSPKVSSM